MIVFGVDGRMTYSNASAQRIVGERGPTLPVADVLASGRASNSTDQIIERQDGTKAHVRTTVSPLHDAGGKVVGAVASLVDLADETSSQRLRGLETIIESMVDGVFVIDRSFRFELANTVGCAMHGLTPEAVLGHRTREFPDSLRMRHPDGKPLLHEELPLVRALGGEIVHNMNKIIFNVKTGRDVCFRVNAAPLRDERGAIVGAVEVARDVTELVELETLKDEFISVAAHELKTPIAVMKGNVEQLRRTAHDMPQGRRQMLDAVERGSDRLARIVQDIVDVSQLYLGKRSVCIERVALRDVVERAVATAGLTARDHQFRIVHLDSVVVRGDPLRIEQVMQKLLDNAQRYSPGGGGIEIDVTTRDLQAVVTVVDHGVGIPKDRQARIFERFYRAHTDTRYDFGGMGVGLYISCQLVRQMGGDMTFVSDEGKGSRFTFTLPIWGTHE